MSLSLCVKCYHNFQPDEADVEEMFELEEVRLQLEGAVSH